MNHLREKSSHSPTHVRRRNLTSIDRANPKDDAGGNTTDDPAGQEHWEVDRSSLQDDADEGNQTSNADRPEPSVLVWKVGIERRACSASCVVCRVEGANRLGGKAIVSDEFRVAQDTGYNAC